MVLVNYTTVLNVKKLCTNEGKADSMQHVEQQALTPNKWISGKYLQWNCTENKRPHRMKLGEVTNLIFGMAQVFGG